MTINMNYVKTLNDFSYYNISHSSKNTKYGSVTGTKYLPYYLTYDSICYTYITSIRNIRSFNIEDKLEYRQASVHDYALTFFKYFMSFI